MAWTQTRMLVPGWYGAGTALLAGDPAIQQAMCERWPPFRVIVSALEAALFRSDTRFADAYAALDPSPDATRLWAMIGDEYERTTAAVLRVTGESSIYARRPALTTRRATRNPWIDPLSAIQIDLLRRRTAGDEAVRQPLLTTMAGIAAGVQSVG
jgi:phosphoenolpyruvate carboxylase